MENETPPGIPGWVKVLGALALAALVLFLVLHWMGGAQVRH